ncbi:MAG: HAD-IIIC family phosphatase [Phycisphaera sp.]|nr:HAD-IIIC family phosphatase [Phycisphaera sp.]
MSSDAYQDAARRLDLPAVDRLGARNDNPPGLSLWQLLREDYRTHGSSIWEQGFWALAVHRFGNWRMDLKWKIFRAPMTLLYFVLQKWVEWTCGITLPYIVMVGRRVRIWHHGGIILGARAIGNDVHIRQNVTLGVAQTWRTEMPIIDDGVDIGCGACVLGDVYVGKRAKIGANAVILSDLPDDATAYGNPARVIFDSTGVSPAAPVASPSEPSAAEPPAPTRHDLGTIALLGSVNMDYLAQQFREVAASHRLALDVLPCPYGQALQQLLRDREDSELLSADPRATLIIERAEDVLGEWFDKPTSVGKSERDDFVAGRMTPLLQSIRLARQKLSGELYVATLAPFRRSALGQADGQQANGLRVLIDEANRQLRAAIEGMESVHLLDANELLADVGRTMASPGKYWYLGRVPFSESFGHHLATRCLGAMLASRGLTARLIVLDLDNTLWGGVVGEDGASGILLGGEFPGNAFKQFQQTLKGFASRGIALAIASKNDEDVALDVIRDHPEMVLREDDFVARRINWEDKAANVASLLDELRLGAASCLFIDDNPVERAKMRAAMPEVCVPEVPRDPALLTSWLLDLPQLDCLTLTESDMLRVSQYHAQSTIKAAQQSFANVDEFLADLGMVLRFEPFGTENGQRMLQLLAKTNQFNATTRRYDASAVRELVEGGYDVIGVGVEDRYSPFEWMGVVVVSPPDAAGCSRIDTFLLSCRILGRHVETAALAWVADRAVERGAKRLIGEIVDTPRNTPVRDLYDRHGFEPIGDGRYTLDLTGEVPIMPACFTVKASTRSIDAADVPNEVYEHAAAASIAPRSEPALRNEAYGADDDEDVPGLRELFRRFFNLPPDMDVEAVTVADVKGWDSLAHLRLMMEVELKMGVQLSGDALGRVRGYADLRRAVLEAVAVRGASSG